MGVGAGVMGGLGMAVNGAVVGRMRSPGGAARVGETMGEGDPSGVKDGGMGVGPVVEVAARVGIGAGSPSGVGAPQPVSNPAAARRSTSRKN